MDGAGWKNAPRERERGDERGCGVAPGSSLSLSLSVSPTSYCEFTRSRSLVDAIFLSISEHYFGCLGIDPLPHGDWIDECCVQDVNRAFWRTDDFATEQGWMLEGGAYQNRHQLMPGPYNLTYNLHMMHPKPNTESGLHGPPGERVVLRGGLPPRVVLGHAPPCESLPFFFPRVDGQSYAQGFQQPVRGTG